MWSVGALRQRMLTAPTAAPRTAAEEEDRASALIPTVPLSTSLPPPLPELDSESQGSFQEALQSEVAQYLFPQAGAAVQTLTTASQRSQDRSWSPSTDTLARETVEQVRRAQALALVHPADHHAANLSKGVCRRETTGQSSEGAFPGTGLLSQFPSLRRKCRLRQIETCCGSNRLTITSGRTWRSQHASSRRRSQLFDDTRENITANVSQPVGVHWHDGDQGDSERGASSSSDSRFRVAPLSSSHGGRVDRHSGHSCGHHHFSSGTSGHTKALAPQSRAFETRVHWKPGEGVGAASKAKCRWCVLRLLQRSSPAPQTSAKNTFLFIAAVLQREVSLGDLPSAFMQSDEDLANRPIGKFSASLLPEAFLSPMGHGLRRVP